MADGDDLLGASAAVGGGGGGDNGRRGRTLMGKGRHVRNTEVDGTARAAAGRRGLRSSPARAKIVAVRLRRWRRRRRRRQVRVDADGQGMRAGTTKTAGEGGH